MYIANEGRLVAFVAPERGGCEPWQALRAVSAAASRRWRSARSGREPPGMVMVQTAFGGRRVMDQLVGDPLPADLLSEGFTGEDVRWRPTTEFVPESGRDGGGDGTRALWITVGQSCEGDSVAMTSATNPSLEDIIQGVIPGNAARGDPQPA